MMNDQWQKQRNGIIGLGEESFRKSYYPDLQEKIEELEYSNENLMAIFNNASDGILIHDENGKILYANLASTSLLKISEKQLKETSIQDLSASDEPEQIIKYWKKAFEGEAVTFHWNVHTFGQERKTLDVQVSVNSTPWYGKKVLVSTFRDFTERIRYEQELFKAKRAAEESDRLKTVFLNNMSHEIRTPLNGIMGFSELLSRSNLDQEKIQNFIRIIRSSSKQLLRIIEDILEISTLESTEIRLQEEAVQMDEFLLELFSIFQLKNDKNKVDLRLSKPIRNGNCNIITDRLKLNKVLSNLLENALKYTSEGHVELGYYIEAQNFVIYVKDTGIGIAEENKERIFERFIQENIELSKNFGGLGLGLSIARENALLLGGNLNVETTKGKGSTFFVSLPYKVVDSDDPNKEDLSTKDKSKDSFLILVAEDEEINYLYIEQLLKIEFKDKIHILHARNGIEAIDLFRNYPEISLVLMDIKMPEMNGSEATRVIKKEKPDLVVIAQTAYNSQDVIREINESGCDGILTKPIERQVLVNLIKKYKDQE